MIGPIKRINDKRERQSSPAFKLFPVLGEESAGTAGVDEQDIVSGLVKSFPGTAHQTGKGLAGVARKPGQSRLELAQVNVNILKNVDLSKLKP